MPSLNHPVPTSSSSVPFRFPVPTHKTIGEGHRVANGVWSWRSLDHELDTAKERVELGEGLLRAIVSKVFELCAIGSVFGIVYSATPAWHSPV